MRLIKLILIIFFTIIPVFNCHSYKVEFIGSDKETIVDEPSTSTGLQYVFVVYDMKSVNTMRITDLPVDNINGLQIYSNLGGGYGQDISYSTAGKDIIVDNPRGDCGYIISTTTGNLCFWVVDYSQHVYSVDMINPSNKRLCESTEFEISGNANAIRYYSIAGRPCTLSREIKLSYNTLQFEEENNEFICIPAERSFEYLESSINVTPAINTKTEVILSGDRFLSLIHN